MSLFRAFSGLLSFFPTFSGPGAFSKAMTTFLDLGPFLGLGAFSEPFRASLLLRNLLAQPASFPLLTWLPALQEFEICSKKSQIGSLAECLLLRNLLAQPACFPPLTWLPALQEFKICSKKPQIGSLAECLLLRNLLAQPACFPLLTWLPALQEFEICPKKVPKRLPC